MGQVIIIIGKEYYRTIGLCANSFGHALQVAGVECHHDRQTSRFTHARRSGKSLSDTDGLSRLDLA
jgi:hypothetical protein